MSVRFDTSSIKSRPAQALFSVLNMGFATYDASLEVGKVAAIGASYIFCATAFLTGVILLADGVISPFLHSISGGKATEELLGGLVMTVVTTAGFEEIKGLQTLKHTLRDFPYAFREAYSLTT